MCRPRPVGGNGEKKSARRAAVAGLDQWLCIGRQLREALEGASKMDGVARRAPAGDGQLRRAGAEVGDGGRSIVARFVAGQIEVGFAQGVGSMDAQGARPPRPHRASQGAPPVLGVDFVGLNGTSGAVEKDGDQTASPPLFVALETVDESVAVGPGAQIRQGHEQGIEVGQQALGVFWAKVGVFY